MKEGPYRTPEKVEKSALERITGLVSHRKDLLKVRAETAQNIVSWLLEVGLEPLEGSAVVILRTGELAPSYGHLTPSDPSGDDSLELTVGGSLGIPQFNIYLSIIEMGRATDPSNPLALFLEMGESSSCLASYRNGQWEMGSSSGPIITHLTQENFFEAILKAIEGRGPYG